MHTAKYAFAIALCLFVVSAFSQSGAASVTGDTLPEHAPIIKGCEELTTASLTEQNQCFQRAIMEFVSKKFKYPTDARHLNVQSKIEVLFVIETSGEISSISVLHGAYEAYKDSIYTKRDAAVELDNAAIKVISKLEVIKPAYKNGQPIRMSVTIPINAKLE